MHKLVVGLIGGIGSGKSLVAAELGRRGGYVISGDRLGHEALRDPAIRERIIEHWGKEILDAEGNVDRRRLGEKVFADPAERKILERLSFPYIERRIIEEVEAGQQDAKTAFIVLDAAVMLEAGWNRHCDLLVFVNAPQEVRQQRLAETRGLSAKEVAKRENAQWPLDEKARQADLNLDNSGPADQLGRNLDNLMERILEQKKKP